MDCLCLTTRQMQENINDFNWIIADDGGKTLKVLSVDILVSENGKDHNTYDYELMERSTGANLVIRRGQPFHLLLKLNRNFDSASDAVSFIFIVAGEFYYYFYLLLKILKIRI